MQKPTNQATNQLHKKPSIARYQNIILVGFNSKGIQILAWSDQALLIQPSAEYSSNLQGVCLVITKGLPAATAIIHFTAREKEVGILKTLSVANKLIA